MAKNKGTPRNPRIKFYFKREEFDFFFQWITGATTHGGTEIGECLYAASQIKKNDEESWIRAWTALGERVEERAKSSAAGGHRVSARESFIRAYSYYRAPLVFISPIVEAERYCAGYIRARACFQQAAALFDPPIEPIEIPFEGQSLPGYFIPADSSGQKLKTLLMLGGGDTFVEDLYGYIGPAAAKRSYNLLMVDLPGQGLLPYQGLTWRADSEAPMKAVVDYALARPDVNEEKLAVYGISGGGYLAPRAVTGEKRIQACVSCSVILDLTQVWNQQLLDLYEKAEHSPIHKIGKLLVQKWRSTYITMVETYVWRFGARSLPDLMRVTQDCQVDPSMIACPILNIMSEQEYLESVPFRGFAQTCQEKIPHPNYKLVILPQNEGGDSHAIGTNLSLMSQTVFDWLDGLFDA